MTLAQEKNLAGNGSVTFWSWNGDMKISEIKEQLNDFANNRLEGVIIHARAGLKIQYMGDLWFKAFIASVEEAQRLGLEVWIYDEDGWPSGFAGGLVPALGREHCYRRLCHAFGRSKIPATIPENQFVTAFSNVGKNEYKRISFNLATDNDLVFWYEIDEHYVDLLNPATTSAFIGFVHEKYKVHAGQYFGTTIKGVFTDEPQLNTSGYVWSSIIEQKYKESYGGNLLDMLYLTIVKGEGYQQFRHKFWTLTSRLYAEAFTKPIARWCDENNLMFTGHFAEEDGLCRQIPGNGGVMTQYQHMQLPGIDHLGSRVASPLLMKQTASVSRQLGSGNVLSETFGCAGWGVPFKQLAWIWGGQSVHGITKPCYHLSAYSIEGTRKRDYPTFFSYQVPWWGEFDKLSQWINGLNRLMTEGERLVHTMVLSPKSTIMSEFTTQENDLVDMRRCSAQYRLLVENLLDLQIDLEIGDEQLIEEHSYLEDGCIVLGKARYDTVFVPESVFIESKTAKMLKEFSEQGGRLIFVNSRPECIGEGDHIDLYDIKAIDIANRRNTLEKLVLIIGGFWQVKLCRPQDLSLISGYIVHTRQIGKHKRIHIWPNASVTKQEVVLSVDGNVSLYKLNVINGEREKLSTMRNTGNRTLTKFILFEKESIIIETGLPSASIDETKLLCENRVMDIHTRIKDKNVLTIDRAAYSIDNALFSDEIPVVKILDVIYSMLSDKPIHVKLKYRFACSETLSCDDMTLNIENNNCTDISINDCSIYEKCIGWWMDKCIGVYPVSENIRSGDNFVTISYNIEPLMKNINTEDTFETEINRFYYPVEPDNIFIRGSFDVVTEAQVENRHFAYLVEDKGFKLCPMTDKTIGDLTIQNMWFYRGDAEYSFAIKVKPGVNRTALFIEKYHGTLLEIKVGDQSLYSFDNPCEIDVTNMLHGEATDVIIRLIGSNRNSLGPHHHKNGETFMINPSMYKGDYPGLGSFMTPWLQGATWADTFGLIPFGIYGITVKTYV